MTRWIAALALGLAPAAAAEPYRGDHHHADQRWATLETRFFRIHHVVDGVGRAPATAARIARVADALALRISAATGWIPRGPYHIVVTDEADGMTAYTLPPWGWIVLSADPGGLVVRLRGRQAWVPDALAHELGHLAGHRMAGTLPPTASYAAELVTVAEVGGVGGAVSVAIGNNVPFGWSEGAAEAWSEQAGVNTVTASRAATVRTAALSGRLLGFDEFWVAADKDAFDAERTYQQGYAFARWLDQTYGRDVLRAMGERAHRRYPLAWPALLRDVTGDPPRIVWARFRAAMYAEAAASAALLRARGITEGVEIEGFRGAWEATDLDGRDRWARRPARDREEARESTGTFELYPRVSPDGRFYAEGKVGWIRVVEADPREWPGADRVARETSDRTAVWLPSILGTSFSFVPGKDALVFVGDADTRRGALGRGTARDAVARLFVADLTPAAVALRHRGGKLAVDAVDVDGRERRRRITEIPGTLRARDPAVSPDGTRIAWVEVADGTGNLVVSALDGGDRRSLSTFDDGTWLEHPAWSPDGRTLVVSMLRADRPDLWTVDVDSGSWTALTDDPQDELDPVWTEDGIWFSSDLDGVFDVYRMDPRGRSAGAPSVIRMTRDLGGAHTPWPMADGTLLYAAHTAHGFKAMRLDASEQLFEPVTAGFGLDPSAEDAAAVLAYAPDPGLPVPERPYQPLRSVLVPGVGPILRVDGVPSAPTPVAGAFVKARDAVERFEFWSVALVGRDLVGDAALTWRGLGPELSVVASGSIDRRDNAGVSERWGAGEVGLEASFWLRRWATATITPTLGATSDPLGVRVASERLAVAVSLGDPPRDSPGASGGLRVTAAHSSPRPDVGGAARWGRAEGWFDAQIAVGAASGPLAEHRHHVELSAFAGTTTSAVSPDERLYAGGDVPGALRTGVPSGSVPMPGFGPYTIGGTSLAVARATYVVPVAARLRALMGPVYARGLDLGVGIGGAVSETQGGLDTTLELRAHALLLDAPWDSVVRFAWGFGATAPSPWTPPEGAAAGPRIVVGIGTGW